MTDELRIEADAQRERVSRPHGRGRQRCTHCELRSVAGLRRGQGLCPYHFTEATLGRELASELHNRPQHTCHYPGSNAADCKACKDIK